jgi:hypothetical protein
LEFRFFGGRDHPTEVKQNDEPVAHLADARDVFGIYARNEVRRVLDLLDWDPSRPRGPSRLAMRVLRALRAVHTGGVRRSMTGMSWPRRYYDNIVVSLRLIVSKCVETFAGVSPCSKSINAGCSYADKRVMGELSD